jgi:hypothetical protein
VTRLGGRRGRDPERRLVRALPAAEALAALDRALFPFAPHRGGHTEAEEGDGALRIGGGVCGEVADGHRGRGAGIGACYCCVAEGACWPLALSQPLPLGLSQAAPLTRGLPA